MVSLGRALRAWISLALRRAAVYGREAERHGSVHALDVLGPDAGDGTGRARVWLRGRLAPRALRSREGCGSRLQRPSQTNGEIPRRRPRRAPRMEWRRRSQLSRCGSRSQTKLLLEIRAVGKYGAGQFPLPMTGCK